MTFAREVKEEIVKNLKFPDCCQKAYFAARSIKSGEMGFSDGAKCCKKAYVTGAFLETGTAALERYHLEFALPSEEEADKILRFLKVFSVRAKKTPRPPFFVVYLKDGDAISDLLALLGAPLAVLKLQNLRAERELSNKVNRETNCITANIEKTVEASARQYAAIEFLKSGGLLGKLPKKLRDAAEARYAHREESLGELKDRLTPLSKSGLNHRLNKIVEYAKKVGENDNR